MSEAQSEQSQDAAQDAGNGFDGEFDADKAKKLIEALRNDKKALQAKVKAVEPKAAQYDQLIAAQQTEAERQAAAFTELQQRAERAEKDALRASVALAKGLPADLASRLQGDDEASLAADADVLLSLIPASTEPRRPQPDLSQGSSAAGGAAVDGRTQLINFIRSQQGNAS